MKQNYIISVANILCFLITILIYGCVEYKEPEKIYNPTATSTSPPVINAIFPADSAMAGVREITIQGENFSTNKYYNLVYFNKYRCLVKSSTSNSIVIYRPPVYGDSVMIRLDVQGSWSRAIWNKYGVQKPVTNYDGSKIRVTRATTRIYSLEIDKDENIYISKAQYIYQILGVDSIRLYKECSASKVGTIYDLKFGPDGYLYIAANKNVIFRTRGESGTTAAEYVTLTPSSNYVDKMEFDQYGNLFTGRTKGLYVVTPAKTIINTNRYSSNFTLADFRVFNDELYIYAVYSGTDVSIPKKAIWKNTIHYTSANFDSVGQSSVFLDILSKPGFETADSISFTFDIAGTMYLCLKLQSQTQSFYVVEPDGSITPFYSDAILPYRINQVVWGNGSSLYLNRGRSYVGKDSAQIYRVGMTVNGAPYWGRNL